MEKKFDALSLWCADQIGRGRSFVGAAAIILLALGAALRLTDQRDSINAWGGAISGYLSILLLIVNQNTQNRQGAASSAKDDEIIRVTEKARNELIGAEVLGAEEIAKLRKVPEC